MRNLLPLLMLGALAACAEPDLGNMPRRAAIDACNKKIEQVTRHEGVEWAPGPHPVANKHDRYWRVKGTSKAGHFYLCSINAVNGDFMTYVY